MKVINEYVIYNPENGEINNTVERLKRWHVQKYGRDNISWYKVTEKAKFDFFDKLKNNTKNVWVEGKRVAYCARKREIASKGRFETIKVNKLINTIVGETQKKCNRHLLKATDSNVMETFLYTFCKQKRLCI